LSQVIDHVDAIAKAVLYEGYLLYPYRRSAVKNQVRWTFGGVHPRTWSEATGGFEPWVQQVQCLVTAPGGGSVPAASASFPAGCRLTVMVRFLRLRACSRPGEPVWQEATEWSTTAPDLGLADLLREPVLVAIELPAGQGEGPDGDGVRREWRELIGQAEVSAEPAGEGAIRLTVRVQNTTPVPEPDKVGREQAMLQSMASTHAVLSVEGGGFVSLSDPPEALRAAALACQNVGVWPVLVGEPGSDHTVLASPIILEDHPQVAPESPMDLFDATEIDEILTLRILTLSDEEKQELRQGDERGRKILERAEALTPDELMRMHGTVRSLRPVDGDDWTATASPFAGESRP
jgi:hydrogenase maturation protease